MKGTRKLVKEYGGQLIKAAGGRWNRKEKLWQLPYGEVLALGLEDRIVNKGEKSVQ